jgi:glycosyltransferase involved in cell wall biosynthesis
MVGGHPRQRVALIVTVLNEASTIDGLLDSIAHQTRAPDEIVIVDGGSRDGTWAVLERWSARLPLRCRRASGVGIAAGRNIAIRAASSDIIAVTDAGVRLEPDWLARLLAALSDDVDVVGGFFRAEADTTFEKAMGAAVLPALEDIQPEKFLPSSRSVLVRRVAWAAIGGYPEWLDYGEDVVFDLALQRAGFRRAFAPSAVVWFRPRGSLAAYFRQYYRYARGDGKADLFAPRHLIRYATYAVAAGLLGWRSWPSWLLLMLGAGAYTRRPYARLWSHLGGLSPAQTAYALALVPLIRFVGDVAKMLGYPVGVLWRLRRAWTSPS